MLIRRLPLFSLLFAVAALPALAQTHSVDVSPEGINFTKGRSWTSTFTGIKPLAVGQLQFTNTSRISSLVRDGKLYLSLNDTIALALENNLDIAIQRFNLPIADTDIMRARGGTAPRGVSTGVVSGTPGGGGATTGTAGASGSGAGGTSTGAGGAGAGAGGIVTSTIGGGPGVPQLDPSFSSSFSVSDGTTPQTSTILTGTNQLISHSTTGNFSYSQGFLPGTSLSVGYDNSRSSSNSSRNLFNPSLSSGLSIQISQPLLQGRGIELNNRNMVTAVDNREIADIAFSQQVMATVAQVEDIYWDLVTANEAVKVAQEAVDLAQKLLNDMQRQVEIGTAAPLQVTQARATLATDQQTLITAQTNLEYEGLLMKNAVTKNLNDPILAVADVVPTDQITIPTSAPIQPVNDLVKAALQYRPELAETRINLAISELSLKATKNELLPSLNVVGSYNASGLAGQLYPGNSPTGLENFIGGFGTTAGQVFGNTYPSYAIGLNLQIPITNHNAQADVARAQLQLAQSKTQQQQDTNNIIITVRQAAYALQNGRAQVQAAQDAVTFNRETLAADQKKLELGASTITQVLTDQSSLTASESNLLSALVTYEENKVNLDRLTGRTLLANHISILDAENGKVTQMPQANQ